MEQHLFIYTRTKHFDYRLVYSPDNQFVPNDIRWKFVDFVREVINEDDPTNGEIIEPRWSFYKIDNYILWGIGCRNSLLGSQDSDYTGTKIRGFYGQIIKVSDFDELSLGFTIDYFKELYAEKIVSIFETKRENEVNSIDSQWQSNVLTRVSKSIHLSLNVNSNVTRILPSNINVQEIVESALSFNEINIVCCLNNEGHARKTELCRFYNVTIIGQNEQKDIHFTQTHEKEEEQPKKGKRDRTSVKTAPKHSEARDSMFDKCFEKLIEGILRMSAMFGLSPNEKINRLANKFPNKTSNNNVEDGFNQTGKEENDDDLQPFIPMKSNREAIRDLAGKRVERKSEKEEVPTSKDDSDIRPISFGKHDDEG